MRALSVKQPWAELIASGRKKIEYRSWQCEHRGDLLIVASASYDDNARTRIDPNALVYGATVCVVDLWKITGEGGEFSWHIRNPRRVEAVSTKGFASLYSVADKNVRFTSAASKLTGTSKAEKTKPKREPRKPIAGKVRPEILVVAKKPGVLTRWQKALRSISCRPIARRDGYGAWMYLQDHPTACVVIDGYVEGIDALDVVVRMRATALHKETPVILAGVKVRRNEFTKVWPVGRDTNADDLIRAIRGALNS